MDGQRRVQRVRDGPVLDALQLVVRGAVREAPRVPKAVVAERPDLPPSPAMLTNGPMPGMVRSLGPLRQCPLFYLTINTSLLERLCVNYPAMAA